MTSASPPVLRTATTAADATRAMAAEVAGLVEPSDIILLVGELGTGKTVFVQGFARGLGVTEAVTSPTFTLVRPYAGARLQLLHADVYRLDHLSEVVDLGLVEQLDDRTVACIEWGDLAAPALPPDFLEVRFELVDADADADADDERSLTLRTVGARWAARAEQLRQAVAPWAVTRREANRP